MSKFLKVIKGKYCWGFPLQPWLDVDRTEKKFLISPKKNLNVRTLI